MGYLVATSGRLLLPEPLEPQVLTVLEVELLRHDGEFREQDVEVVDSLADLARFAGIDLVRDGDWLLVSPDRAGEPRWSPQAAAFYEGLARWVLQGEVQVRSEDGQQWSYRYTPEGLVRPDPQDAGGPPVAAPGGAVPADPTPAPAPPAPPPSPPPPSPPPPLPEPPVTGEVRPTWDEAFWADDPTPRTGGRTVAMTLLLVVGVLLIIGVASLAAGVVG